MKIAVCSMFRDSQQWFKRKILQVDKYFESFKKEGEFHDLSFFALEGDSVDDTFDRLNWYSSISDVTLIKHDTEVQFFGSVNQPDRLHELSKIGNIVLEKAREREFDYLLWIESDLIFTDLIGPLLKGMRSTGAAMIAPVTMLHNGTMFYDTWGFIDIDGKHWTNNKPYSKVWKLGEQYVQMKSIGSCALIDFRYIKEGANFGTNCFQGLCSDVSARGGTIYADLQTTIYHPSRQRVKNRWV